jgi:hypothetical protein
MVAEITLAGHIAAGAIAIALGPLAVRAARRGDHGIRLAKRYHWAVLAVSVSAGLLAALDWSRLWWFVPIAAGSYALALLGYVASGRRGPRWVSLHVHGQGGSYIALMTALVVVSVGSPLAWVAPTLVGSPLVAQAARRARARTRRAATLTEAPESVSA